MTILPLLEKLQALDIRVESIGDKLKINAPDGKLTPALINELKDKKEELIKFLQKNLKDQADYKEIESVEEREYYNLSSAQNRIYFLQMMDLDSTVYHLKQITPLNEDIDRKELEDVFKKLIERHSSLRTSFIRVNDRAVQRVQANTDFQIQYYDASLLETEVKVEEVLRNFVRPFDLSKAPLLRVGLIKKRDQGHIIIVDMHHIISDGMSNKILLKDFISLYKGEELAPPRLQYKDYAEWQNRRKRGGILKYQEDYWLKEYQEEIPILNLPVNFSRTSVQSFKGGILPFYTSKEETDALKNVALERGFTLYTTLLAAVNILMFKLTGQEDIIIGTPTTGRIHADLMDIIGMFVNTLAIRNFPSADKTFNTLLEEVNKRALHAFENQDYQFEDLVEKLALHRDTARNPLFDVMFVWQNIIDYRGAIPVPGNDTDRDSASIPDNLEMLSKFDLTLTGMEGGGGVFWTITYCAALFRKEAILRFIRYFRKIISSVLKYPNQKISAIEILSEEEKNQVLYDFNTSEAEFSWDTTIHRLFEDQAERTPDHIAVVGLSVEDIQKSSLQDVPIITYRELNAKSNRLARVLREKGVRPDTIAGLMVEPSLELIIGILGILKAGGAYLPLDPGQPAERISYMLTDSRSILLLTTRKFISEVAFSDPTITFDDDVLYRENSTGLEASGNPGNILYSIYTSGTTGKSKGVLIEHRNLVNYVNWFNKKIGLTFDDRVILASSFAFDLGYTAIYPSILSGSQLHIVPKQFYLSTKNLLEYIRKNRVTYIKVTPSLFSAILENFEFSNNNFQTLRLVVLGGEAIKIKDVETAHEIGNHLQVMNHYGPTESTIGCVAQWIDFGTFEEFKKQPTIGYPIDNMKVYILDKKLYPVPVEISGELCVSGAGVARGYLNRPELTAEKFVLWEQANLLRTRLYKTGDMARWTEKGTVEFLGRIDHQVKIRGYRIELGEIENLISNHSEIDQAIVLFWENEKGNKYLCAYFVADRPIVVLALKEYLLNHLPDYMVPSFFVQLDKMPLTPNGKIDGKSLPDPMLSLENHSEFIAPRDDTDEKLAVLWSEILGIEKGKISIEANFFEMGGNSLFLIMLFSRVKKDFGIEIPITQLYDNPTIKKISTTIESNHFIEQPVSLLNRLNRKKIFAFPPQFGYGFYYSGLAAVITDYSFYALSFIEEEDRLKKYVDIITGLQPGGPYIFFGHSAAGRLTIQVAKALEELGYEVSDIIFCDCFFSEDHTIDTIETDVTEEEGFKQIASYIESKLKILGVSFLYDQVIQKTIKYINYYSSIKSLAAITANIHLILSELPREDSEKKCWEKYTTEVSSVYQGFGSHRTMLDPGPLEKNAAIVREILNKIEAYCSLE